VESYVVESLTREEKLRFLRALEEDAEFRYAVAGAIGMLTVVEELRRLREDFNRLAELEERRWEEERRRWEENEKRWEENARRWEENWRLWEENRKRWEEAYRRFEAIEEELRRLREDHNRLREDFNKAYESFMRRMDSFERKLIALGTRWGVESEKAFREAMRGIVEEILGVAKVEKWRYYDREGEVLGYPAWVEVDLAIRNGVHVLIEVKASASDSDVVKLWKIGRLYERVVGAKPRLVLVTPFIDESGVDAARRLGVEVYTKT
jgi:hypothetical protein